MRILMISDHADPLAKIGIHEAGGQNIFVYNIAKQLAARGIAVDVYTRWDSARKHNIVQISKNFRVIRVKAGPKRYVSRDSFLVLLPEFTRTIWHFIEREGISYHVIFSNYWFSGLAGIKLAELLQIPQIHVYHSIGKMRFDTLKDYMLQNSDYIFYKKRIAAEEHIAKTVSHIVATSPGERQYIVNSFQILPNKVSVIPIGVNTRLFSIRDSSSTRQKLGLPTQDKIVLYVGRLEWRKGVGTLLYAFQRLLPHYPDSHLVIIGGTAAQCQKINQIDSEEQRLHYITHELGIQARVIFLNAQDQRSLPDYYSAADVCVVPSYYESFGIVPLEAMACGTPVVASATGGLMFTVRHGITGYHALPRNFRDLADKIGLVLALGKQRYTPQCLQHIQRYFLWSTITNNFIQTFQLVKEQIHEHRPTRPIRGISTS